MQHFNMEILKSRLSDMIEMVEILFGPRDESYTVVDIEIEHKTPKIWFPDRNGKDIIIRLSVSPSDEICMSRSFYQLAHETVHLLAPIHGTANNLEEATATYFAAYYMRVRLNEPAWKPGLESYAKVLEIVKPVLDKDIHCIKKLREKEPSFSKMTREQVSPLFPDDANFLIETFERGA